MMQVDISPEVEPMPALTKRFCVLLCHCNHRSEDVANLFVGDPLRAWCSVCWLVFILLCAGVHQFLILLTVKPSRSAVPCPYISECHSHMRGSHELFDPHSYKCDMYVCMYPQPDPTSPCRTHHGGHCGTWPQAYTPPCHQCSHEPSGATRCS